MELWNLWGQQNTITDALQLEIPEHAVICITGAGGKTSLLFTWARELAAAGKKVAVTTTTHMFCPGPIADESITFVADPDPDMPGKVQAPPAGVIDQLREKYDVVLIEADGSKRMPLKWPAEWEPVIPEYTDIIVCVAGLSSLDRPASEVIFRYADMPDAMKRETVTEDYIRAILSSPYGGLKDVRGEFRVFLNQADDEDARQSAAKIQTLLGVMGIQSAWGKLRPESYRIAVILEAAGYGSRFGSNKLLHKMADGRPMIASVLDAVRPLDVYQKILVTQYDEVAEMAPDFKVVRNDRPDLGISRSMQLGIQAAGDSDAYMFCVCDQPGLTTSTIERLIEVYKNGTAGIVSLAWQGTMCNPKIFSSRFRSELMELSGDTGGRQIISAHKDTLELVEVESEDEVTDIDEHINGTAVSM